MIQAEAPTKHIILLGRLLNGIAGGLSSGPCSVNFLLVSNIINCIKILFFRHMSVKFLLQNGEPLLGLASVCFTWLEPWLPTHQVHFCIGDWWPQQAHYLLSPDWLLHSLCLNLRNGQSLKVKSNLMKIPERLPLKYLIGFLAIISAFFKESEDSKNWLKGKSKRILFVFFAENHISPELRNFISDNDERFCNIYINQK